MNKHNLVNIAFLVIVFALIFLPGSAISAINNYNNATPGSVDNNDPDFEARTFDVSTSAPITDINIVVDFHKIDGDTCGEPGTGNSWSDEIAFKLVSPLGTEVLLVSNGAQGSGDTYANGNAPRVTVTFDDEAIDIVGSTNGGIPESGTFQPVNALSTFDGENPNGTWEFQFQDDTVADWLCFYEATLIIEDDDSVIPASIPTLSEWGMIFMSLLIAGSAMWMMRTRQM